jgi:hypothetical protein
MPVLNPGTTFANGEQLTASDLNLLVQGATFTQSSVDNQSTQLVGTAIVVADGGIIAAKLAAGAVTFAKLADVIDDDTMGTATDTTLATSKSIKAYVDAGNTRQKYVQLTSGTHALIKTNTSAATLTYNIADFTSSDVDFTTSAITAIIIQGYVGSDSEGAVSINATVPSGQEINVGYLHTFGDNLNKGRSASTATLPINEGQSSFDVIYSGGTVCQSTIFGAIIN